MVKLTADQANAILSQVPRAKHDVIDRVLRKPPTGTAPELLAAEAVSVMTNSPWQFARQCGALPAQAMRVVLELLREIQSPYSVYLRSAIDAEAPTPALDAGWQKALQGILNLEVSYPMGSKLRVAKLKTLLSDPTLRRAIQASAVVSENPPHPILEALIFDGSDESVDALMPFFTKAMREKDHALDRLQSLRKYAADTPAMRAMLQKVDHLLDVRNETSPALAFAEETLRLGVLKRFSFDVRLGSTQLTRGNVPRVQGTMRIDSGATPWFRVWVTRLDDASIDLLRPRNTSTFDANGRIDDQLGLGSSAPEQWPLWLAGAAKHLKVTWELDDVITSSLRGRKRQQILDWLYAEL